MTTTQWLTIQEYSNKHRVSISTLRRRIKSKSIEYSFKDGKYLIRDDGEIRDEKISSFSEMKDLYQKDLEQKQEKILRLENQIKQKERRICNLESENQDLNQLVELLEEQIKGPDKKDHLLDL